MEDTTYTTHKLADGRTATIMALKGRHMIAASTKAPNSTSLAFYYIVEVTFINGKQIDFEDLQQMDAADVSEIMNIIASQLNKSY